jgi:Leu/Phe-tRNA-protein transferase
MPLSLEMSMSLEGVFLAESAFITSENAAKREIA